MASEGACQLESPLALVHLGGSLKLVLNCYSMEGPVPGGGISLRLISLGRSTLSTRFGFSAWTSLFGDAVPGEPAKGGPFTAATLAQELVLEPACELALKSRLDKRSRPYGGPSPDSCPAAMDSMWWRSANAANGALAAATNAVAVVDGARLLAVAGAGVSCASAAGCACIRFTSAGEVSADASPPWGGRSGGARK